jgi:tRNA threonylcarbamoyladenosine modification (KEOPS) complex  Pcc1 subunit
VARMECSGKLRFSFPGAKQALQAKKALGKAGPESGRSTVGISARGKELVAEFSASDPVALRAAVNTVLRHIKVIDDLGGVWDEQGR